MKIKIQIIADNELGMPDGSLKKINNYFENNLFEIPFMPQIGMKIDLDDFYTDNVIDVLGYSKITDIIILREYIELHC
jgi:hypothetical protein